MPKKIATALLIATVIAMMFLSITVPQVAAASKSKITFKANGYTNYDGALFTIDGTQYTYWTLPSSFNWEVNSQHTVVAYTPFTNWNGVAYKFNNWTNGNGLTGISGTFTTPSAATTVTANYIQSTYKATFTGSGLKNFDSAFLIIDGTTYTYSSLGASHPFSWDAGSTHTVQAISPVKSWDYPPKNYAFQSWTNGNGLVTVSGTFMMPSSDVIVTANYGSATHIAKFAVSGLSKFDDYVIKIDGTSLLASSLSATSYAWDAGTTHTIEALTPVKSYDTPQKSFNFTSWTNGNGLTAASGTFTMPNTDVTLTANYAQSSARVTFATSGLSNVNNDVILTIDGVSYTYWTLQNINVQWGKTSTHTITAVTSINSYGGTQYQFNGWTNGNGLTTNTGTFTTPDSDVVVTLNYGQKSAAETTLTMSCEAAPVNKGNSTLIIGRLTSQGSPVNGKTITLQFDNGSAWVSIGSTTTLTDGTYSFNWTVPTDLPNGQYPVKAEFAGDCNYKSSSAVSGSCGNGPSMFVVPESPLGAAAMLIACLAAGLVYLKLRGRCPSA